ncbi:hypothetical protein DFH27DRAFT_597360 [Peziza echinospora]|nr:hypothetical protein DFH27DRAFT_597360 [Peziza echinospora]
MAASRRAASALLARPRTAQSSLLPSLATAAPRRVALTAAPRHHHPLLTRAPLLLRRPSTLPASASTLLTRGLHTTPSRRLATPTKDDDSTNPLLRERESDSVDVCIVGGGPAGLSAAIRLKQLANDAGNEDFRVLLLEKAPDMGAHIVSGAVIEPTAINDLLPDWLSEDNPNRFEGATAVTSDKMRFLTKNRSFWLPEPPQMRNEGNYIISLNELVKWMAERAEELGVEIYPGFAASELLYNPDGGVKGVATNDLGIGRDGKPKDSFERGMEFHAKCTLFAEGCHGSLTKQVIKKFDLRKDSQPQTYGLGLKEVWEVKPENFRKGEVSHSLGWPLPLDTYGGAFMYHFAENKVALGLVVGLDYPNPYLSPYEEFQRMKHHPFFKEVLEGGTPISYAARALNEGGFQSIPKVAFPGGGLIGCTAGFLNLPKIKGIHTSMRSGMLAAESAYSAILAQPTGDESTVTRTLTLPDYESKLKQSHIWKELYEIRNLRPSFHSPLKFFGGVAYSGLETFLLKGRVPWTLKHPSTDYDATKLAADSKKIEYPKPDGKLSFDILTSVSRTGTNHEEDQPVHLVVGDTAGGKGGDVQREREWRKHAEKEWPRFKGLEARFCPAAVYEYVEDEKSELGVRFQVNAQNCIHCKTCDIKAPSQDINWVTPQGGEGPKYYKT